MRQNNEERETGHVYSTVFQSSIGTSIDKGEGEGEKKYSTKKKKREVNFLYHIDSTYWPSWLAEQP